MSKLTFFAQTLFVTFEKLSLYHVCTRAFDEIVPHFAVSKDILTSSTPTTLRETTTGCYHVCMLPYRALMTLDMMETTLRGTL